jgi:hypothetical protein
MPHRAVRRIVDRVRRHHVVAEERQLVLDALMQNGEFVDDEVHLQADEGLALAMQAPPGVPVPEMVEMIECLRWIEAWARRD